MFVYRSFRGHWTELYTGSTELNDAFVKHIRIKVLLLPVCLSGPPGLPAACGVGGRVQGQMTSRTSRRHSGMFRHLKYSLQSLEENIEMALGILDGFWVSTTSSSKCWSSILKMNTRIVPDPKRFHSSAGTLYLVAWKARIEKRQNEADGP